MLPQISKALSSGFTAKQVIDYILKKFPDHSGKIKDALAAGFSVDQVLKFISGGKKALSTPETTQEGGSTEYQQMQSRNIGRREEVNKRGLQAASLAATSLAAPMASAALQRAIPSSVQALASGSIPLPGQSPSPSPTNLSTGTQQQTQLGIPQQPPVNQVSPTIPQTPQVVQPEGNITNIIKNTVAIKHTVDNLASKGNGPEEIAAYLNKFDKQTAKTIEKMSKVPLKDALTAYLAEKQATPQPEMATSQAMPQTEAAAPIAPVEANVNPLDIEAPEEAKPIAKNELAASPQGVGHVLEVRGNKALIEIDGKKHQVNLDELESSPLPEKDLAELHDELLRGIEAETGEDVSRMVQWAGYNPETNTLQFLPHTGKLYKYGDISPEDAALLTDILSVRKTSGSNFIGAWKKDSKSPIGAALSKLIRKLQSERGGKGQEYEETHEPIYSAYEPAIEFKKNKKKKK